MYRVLRLVLNKKQGSRKFGKQVLDLMALRGCERDLFRRLQQQRKIMSTSRPMQINKFYANMLQSGKRVRLINIIYMRPLRSRKGHILSSLRR